MLYQDNFYNNLLLESISSQANLSHSRSNEMEIHPIIPTRILLVCALLLASVFCINSVNASTVVIVNKDNPVASLTQAEIKQLFLKQNKYFPNGSAVLPVDQNPGQAIKKDFYQSVAHMTGSQWLAYWSKLIFTGKKNPPRLAADNLDVVELVASNPKYIGYIDLDSIDSRVKVVYSVPN